MQQSIRVAALFLIRMGILIDLFHNLTDPAWIMQHGGLYIVAAIIFAETGLFVGFFLPGDTILFIAGMIIAHSILPEASGVMSLLYWIAIISTAGIVGNYLGYWIGKKFGSGLMTRKDTWIFKKKHLHNAKDFYDKRGGGAIVVARFLPIVRTFAPVVAGIVSMKWSKFSLYNIVGSFIWVGSIVSAGYLLGENKWVQGNLDIIIIGIVGVTTFPVLMKMFATRFKAYARARQLRKRAKRANS